MNTPSYQFDPASLPPRILTSEAGSFAHETFKTRVHGILRDVSAANDFPPETVAALAALSHEIAAGTIRPLHEAAPDTAYWAASAAPYAGRSWLDAPWYWAETYFYRRILEATGYFQPGLGLGADPYAAIKRQEWASDAAPAAVSALLAELPDDPEERFQRLLHASLWGNRTDLSYRVAAHLGATASPSHEQDNLVADDSRALWDFVQNLDGSRVALIADNAGTELLMDITLIDFLIVSGCASEVLLYLKPQPFFVSDAMPADLVAGLDALVAGGELGRKLAYRVDGHIAAGELLPKVHRFFPTDLFYFQMPADLAASLAGMDLVIVKGDVNYRRLLGDAHWPYTTPFAEVVRYFPAPVAALRTLKGELIVGLKPGDAERLAAEDPAWLINGRRGVIQFQMDEQMVI